MGTSSTNTDGHIVIQPATSDDIGKVRNLLVATWHDTYDSLLGVEQVTKTTNQWHALDVLATQATRPNTSSASGHRGGTTPGGDAASPWHETCATRRRSQKHKGPSLLRPARVRGNG
jgi:hypothetical protein